MEVKLSRCFLVMLWTLSVLGASVSCTAVTSEPIELAAFTENYVEVSISLQRDLEGSYVLSGTFLPPDEYHLYSKDIPLNGVDGLGRPTLLELTSTSQIKAIGELIESVQAQEASFEPKELFVYPAGAVTLSLPVELPSGDRWVNDEIKITYMACSASQCKPPVEGKVIAIRVPGADMTDAK